MTFQAQGTVIDKLKQLGINEEKLALMPDALKVPLLCGEVTPVFIANTETSNGKVRTIISLAINSFVNSTVRTS